MFNNLKISEKCKKELTDDVLSNKLSHAVILEGADEGTRLLAAKELAKAVLCNGSNKPCNVCSSCVKANADSHPDIHFLKKSDTASTIKVDEIRELKAKAALLPNDADKCVFIISEAQDMGVAAQNALLKIFEEPAFHVSFILTCNSKSAFLDTIISRGSIYCLSSDDISVEDNEKTAAAKEYACKLLNTLCSKSEYDFLCLTAAFQKDKELFELTLDHSVILLRDALVDADKNGECISGNKELVKLLNTSFSKGKLIEYINITRDFSAKLNASANNNLLLTRLCSIFYSIKIK